jgi:hypothetical protein
MIKIGVPKDTCWWCGKSADSREHKHKRTDITNVFKDFSGNPIIIKDGKEFDLKSPKSKKLKFGKILCQDCNTTRSQPFDFAYDIFIKYIENNRNTLIAEQQIDFERIFSNNPLEGKLNVLKYYIKHIGCRLAMNGISIDEDLLGFLNGFPTLNKLYINFEIRMDLVAFIDRLKRESGDIGNLYVDGLRYFTTPPNNEIEVVYSFYTYRWFRMSYFYSDKITDEIYPGYNNYNASLKIPSPALYIVEPIKYESLTSDELLEELKSHRKPNLHQDLINSTFSSNPFQRFDK